MILLLPDFIGHPGCFNSILPLLHQPIQLVNYNYLTASVSLSEMATQIAASLTELPLTILGYSFGGALGFELAKILPDGTQLIMIDSRFPDSVLRNIPAKEQYQRWLTPENDLWIELLEELGEIDKAVIMHHITLFSEWKPKGSLRNAWLIACPTIDKKNETRWRQHISDLRLINVNSNHNEVMLDPATHIAITALNL